MISVVKEPAASRKTLVMTAGIVWLTVGTILALVAVIWLSAASRAYYILTGAALVAGLIISRFGFSRILKKNVQRIRELSPHKSRICIFAFQAVQSYLLIIVMMALGFALRQLPLPHAYLAAIYIAIGTALVRSSLDYIKASRTF